MTIFQEGLEREYTLPWGDGANPERHGTIKMTGGLFNYYFRPSAFQTTNNFYERSVRATGTYNVTRRIGGPSKEIAGRKSYTIRVSPTSRSNGYDTGQQMYAIDGDHRWNFEITGRVTEFRLWLRELGAAGKLNRTFIVKTATGVGSSSVPLTAGN